MPRNKRNLGIPRKRTLLIHHNLRLRRQLADSLAESGWRVFEAESRTDGLRLLFDVEPDVVFLEVTTGLNESWDTLQSIRLFTSAPVIILADQQYGAIEQSVENSKPMMLIAPVSTARVIAVAKGLGKYSTGSTPSSKQCSRGTTFVASLRGLTTSAVVEIDRVLSQICNRDEVRVILRGGRLQPIAELPDGKPNSGLASP